MIANLKRTLTPTRLGGSAVLILLIVAGLTVSPRLAQSRGRCPSCFSLQTFGENFDSVTSLALPVQWLAKRAGAAAALGHIEERCAQSSSGHTAQRCVH
jgi:hypothetical protein